MQFQNKEVLPPTNFSSVSSTFTQNPKTFSFQTQLNNSNQDNKENLDNSLRKDYEFLLDSTKNEQKPLNLNEKFQNAVISNATNAHLERNELDQMMENKNIILKKLKLAPRNTLMVKEEENKLFSERFSNQKIVKNSSTLKKPTHYQENENSFRNDNFELYENFEENNNLTDYQPKIKDIEICRKVDVKLVEDYRRQIDLLEKNFEKQKNQQNEINEYRKLINHFEEKINLLIDDNQRLVGVVEIERDELVKFKVTSEEMIRNYQEKVSSLEKDIKFKEDRYYEAILCLDSYKAEIEKLKDFNTLTERDRRKMIEESKKTNLKLLEFEQNEEKTKNSNQSLTSKMEYLQSELNDLKSKRETLEKNLKEILKKNQILNKDLNQRIGELNTTKKELEIVKQENEKVNFQKEQLQTRFDELKEEKLQELKQIKEEFILSQEKTVASEKNLKRIEEINKNLESSLKRMEIELKEKDKSSENVSNYLKEDLEKLNKELKNKMREIEDFMKEKDAMLGEISHLKEQIQKLLRVNENLKKTLEQVNNDYQMQFANHNKNTQNQKMSELKELANNFKKQMLEKTKFNNEVMTKNQALTKEIQTLKLQKEDYKQKLAKMDFNYSKAMQELKKSYEQEKSIKSKDFQYQLSDINNMLLEKEKQINHVSKEKQELLIILRKTTEELNKKCTHEVEAKSLKKMIEEKANENDFLKRGISLNRIRNHSAERDMGCDKGHHSIHDYRRSLHLLRENDNLNNDVYKNYLYLY